VGLVLDVFDLVALVVDEALDFDGTFDLVDAVLNGFLVAVELAHLLVLGARVDGVVEVDLDQAGVLDDLRDALALESDQELDHLLLQPLLALLNVELLLDQLDHVLVVALDGDLDRLAVLLAYDNIHIVLLLEELEFLLLLADQQAHDFGGHQELLLLLRLLLRHDLVQLLGNLAAVLAEACDLHEVVELELEELGAGVKVFLGSCEVDGLVVRGELALRKALALF